jgi:hypothetical protein
MMSAPTKRSIQSSTRVLSCAVYLLLGTLTLFGFVACSNARSERHLYRDVASWLDTHALSVETLAIPMGERAYFEGRTTFELPTDQNAFAVLALLDAEHPDYVLAVDCVALDGVRVQPWFQARYREVQTWRRAEVAGSPFTLFAYQPSPFDGATDVPVEGRFETAAVVLRGFALSSSRVMPGEPLHLLLYWDDLPGQDFSDLVAVVRLVGFADGEVWDEVRHRLRPSGVTWSPEARLARHSTLVVPEDLPEGEYAIEVALRIDGGQTIPVSSTSGRSPDHLLLTTVSHPPDVARTPIPMDYQVDYRFGEAIDLVGYNAPRRAEPGDQIRVTFLWHALTDVTGDYTVFVHVLDARGSPVAQDDGKPVYWFYPTTAWEPGDHVRDEHTIVLPPALQRGDYRLSVGLYNADTGDRVIVQGPVDSSPSDTDHVILHTLAVR